MARILIFSFLLSVLPIPTLAAPNCFCVPTSRDCPQLYAEHEAENEEMCVEICNDYGGANRACVSSYLPPEEVIPGFGGSARTYVGFGNPLCLNPAEECSVPVIIGNIIRVILGVVGSIALLMFVIGGFQWMLSAGNQKTIDRAKATLKWSALGLIVIFAGYIIVNTILQAAVG